MGVYLEFNKNSLVKVVYFILWLLKSIQNILFLLVGLFARIISTLIGSMELFQAKKFVVVESWWVVEGGTYCMSKKFSGWLDPGGE